MKRVALVVALSFAAFGTLLGGVAQAADPPEAAPAWKLLAVTGPTNLPTQQSETQRVTVEAEGGTFTLGYKPTHVTVKGVGTPVVYEAHLSVTSGSPVATIVSVEAGASIATGDRMTFAGEYEEGIERLVVSCSSDCKTPGSTITFSTNSTKTNANAAVEFFTKGLSGVTGGSFQVGDEILKTAKSGAGPFEFFRPGTIVTAVGPGTLTLSKPTTFEYLSEEGALEITGERTIIEQTGALPYNASAEEVQQALQAIPRFSGGTLTVEGGPGRSIESPYSVAFGGTLANTDIAELEANGAALLGPNPAVRVATIVPGGRGTGEIVISPINIGGATTSGATTLKFGPLPVGIVTAAKAFDPEGIWNCPGGAGASTVTCTSSAAVGALQPANTVVVPVQVELPETSGLSAAITIEGGNATAASYQVPIVVSNQQAPFGIQAFWAGAFDEKGNRETQAGAHPFSAQTFLRLNTVRATSGKIVPSGDSRNVFVDLPPGFVGNPLITQRCPQQQLTAPGLNGSPLCNKEGMSIGEFSPVLVGFTSKPAFQARIFNDVPAFGHAAEFTTILANPLQSLVGSVRASEDFGVTIAAPNNANVNKIFGAYAALEGRPASGHGSAFLDNPTACAQQREEFTQGRGPATEIEAASWQAPSAFDHRADSLPPITNCMKLTESWEGKGNEPREPSFAFEPSTTTGSSPAGATARLHIPQAGLTEWGKLATAHLKKAVVTLPQGLTVNPSSANGLEACSESQIGLLGTNFPSPTPIRFDESTPSCPDGSKLGTFQASTPLLEEKIDGTIYLATQNQNPFHSLIALYLVVESPRFGLTLKLAGEVKPDPNNGGQLTATFDNNPQVPVEDLTLHFRGGGPRSELATPEVCGHYSTTGSLTPWSAESGEAAPISEAGFSVSGNCASSPGARPFSPSFEAGTTAPQAGTYSPMVIRINRKDGEQELERLNFTLPLGVVAKLAGIPYCPDSAIAAASGKSGRSELASSSCPSSSQIGTVDTAAGVGSEPVHVGGRVYLAGPYEGAPISTVVITPAVAGPFDLGTVVVRAPAFLNLETAQITVKSDPVPTMLQGLPLKLRSVVINVDRPNFMLNPTNCAQQAFSASLQSSNGATASPSNRFQVGGCEKLKFKPGLKLTLKGATKRSGHPALKAVVTYPKKGAYSNVARAQVGLPHSEFLDQGNLDKVCTQPQLKSGTCPKGSVYGHAKAWTPLLEKPLEGPVYIGVGYGHKLPDLVADLNGQVRILLHGKVDTTKHEGIRNTFEVVPDAPVSRFVLEMKGGKKYGLLENSENICRKTQRASAFFTAQNGLSEHLQPLIGNDCKKKKGKKGQGKKKHGS